MDNRPGFPFMPFPIGGWMQPQNQIINQTPVTHGPPPARVRVALEFLTDLMVKGMTRAAINDLTIELIPGQQLSHDEKETQKAACECLKQYFRGETKPDVYERVNLKKKSKQLGNGEAGLVLSCIGCGGQYPKVSQCRICKGSGEILVFPTTHNNSSDEDKGE